MAAGLTYTTEWGGTARLTEAQIQFFAFLNPDEGDDLETNNSCLGTEGHQGAVTRIIKGLKKQGLVSYIGPLGDHYIAGETYRCRIFTVTSWGWRVVHLAHQRERIECEFRVKLNTEEQVNTFDWYAAEEERLNTINNRKGKS